MPRTRNQHTSAVPAREATQAAERQYRERAGHHEQQERETQRPPVRCPMRAAWEEGVPSDGRSVPSFTRAQLAADAPLR